MTHRPADRQPDTSEAVDAVVVGAGIGGIYAVHRLGGLGLSVVGVEGGGGVGGVWHHNRYPGARVDLEGLWYCYHDPELYREWRWTERYPAQPELLRYLEFVAGRWGVIPKFRFRTWVRSAAWTEGERRWRVETDDGAVLVARYLVMATGPLSAARRPDIAGLDDFGGMVLWTSHWPDPAPDVTGKRIGIIGTSASGVQAVPHLARWASHLTVFQRTPHYSAPAHNHMLSAERIRDHVQRAETLWQDVVSHPGGTDIPLPAGKAATFTPEERQAILEARWAYGAHALGSVFTDQGTDLAANDIVAEFVRGKIREKVRTPQVAERLMPRAYPIGTHRLAVDVEYYETFNRDNVTLVPLLDNPIERVVDTGVLLHDGTTVTLDVLVLATGFLPFTGALYAAHLSGAGGEALEDHWAQGPMAYLGLMTHGFPNLFMPTAPGSPSVLANMFADNEHQLDLVSRMLVWMADRDYTRVEPTADAEEWWKKEMRAASEPLLRNKVPNYMSFVVPADGSRMFLPYPGGFDRFVRICDEVVDAGFKGFTFR